MYLCVSSDSGGSDRSDSESSDSDRSVSDSSDSASCDSDIIVYLCCSNFASVFLE